MPHNRPDPLPYQTPTGYVAYKPPQRRVLYPVFLCVFTGAHMLISFVAMFVAYSLNGKSQTANWVADAFLFPSDLQWLLIGFKPWTDNMFVGLLVNSLCCALLVLGAAVLWRRLWRGRR